MSKVLATVVGLALFFSFYMVSQKFTSADVQLNVQHLMYSKVIEGPLTICASGNGILVP